MDMLRYWLDWCAPYLRNRVGRSERGASPVEYALLVALIAGRLHRGVTLFGKNASKKVSSVGSAIQ
ncbi:MAG: Flp family type IVb pilin [Acidimicrobiales bacterium]